MAAPQQLNSQIPLTGLNAQCQSSSTTTRNGPPRNTSNNPPRYTSTQAPANTSTQAPANASTQAPANASTQAPANASGQPPLRPTSHGKTLPRRPHGWARVCHETSLFLRSIGLGIIVSNLSGLFSKGFSEPTKVAIRRNRVTALLRSLIHAIPMGVALMEIILNWKGYYVGAKFTKQPYYQFAAKAHEITIQASLAFMVLSLIRYTLIFCKGLPFGTLLGGLQFLQVSYLWSTEFWSSITSKHIGWKTKLALTLVIVVCSIIAATAGPASATLLIPRQVNWSLPSSSFAINGQFQNVWPDYLDNRNIPVECAVQRASEVNSLCPGGDWYTIINMIGKISTTRDLSFNNSADHVAMIFSDPITGTGKLMVAGPCPSGVWKQICGTTTQSLITGGTFMNDKNYWVKDSAVNKTAIDMISRLHQGYYQPYVVASCVLNTVTESTKQESLQFPDITETDTGLSQERLLITLPNLTRADALRSPGNVSQFRLKWVDFPQRLFNDKLFGAIILHPGGSAANYTQNITTCTFGAGWGTSAIQTSLSAGNKFLSTIENVPESWPRYDRNALSTGFLSTPNYANISGYVYPQRRIYISSDWATFSNPTLVGVTSYNTTALDRIITSMHGPLDEVKMAFVLNLMLATSLARTGIDLGWQDISSGAVPCDGCLKFEVEHSVTGWAYIMQGNATKLSITVMIVYCTLAFAHILYLGISGISSTAWDSIAEIVALAMNSSPTRHLQNTCAGILGAKVFQNPVKIMVTNPDGGKDEHLELVFGDEEQGNANMSRMEMNKEYGRLHTD